MTQKLNSNQIDLSGTSTIPTGGVQEFESGSSQTFAAGSTQTHESGSTTDFEAGAVVDFTGATVTGLSTSNTVFGAISTRNPFSTGSLNGINSGSLKYAIQTTSSSTFILEYVSESNGGYWKRQAVTGITGCSLLATDGLTKIYVSTGGLLASSVYKIDSITFVGTLVTVTAQNPSQETVLYITDKSIYTQESGIIIRRYALSGATATFSNIIGPTLGIGSVIGNVRVKPGAVEKIYYTDVNYSNGDMYKFVLEDNTGNTPTNLPSSMYGGNTNSIIYDGENNKLYSVSAVAGYAIEVGIL
jgi:hypothetical protein